MVEKNQGGKNAKRILNESLKNWMLFFSRGTNREENPPEYNRKSHNIKKKYSAKVYNNIKNISFRNTFLTSTLFLAEVQIQKFKFKISGLISWLGKQHNSESQNNLS